MPTNQPALRAYTNPGSGTRPRGRPTTKWIDNLGSVLEEYELSQSNATLQAKERKLFLSATPRQEY